MKLSLLSLALLIVMTIRAQAMLVDCKRPWDTPCIIRACIVLGTDMVNSPEGRWCGGQINQRHKELGQCEDNARAEASTKAKAVIDQAMMAPGRTTPLRQALAFLSVLCHNCVESYEG